MNRQRDAFLLGHWQDPFKEPCVVVPAFFFGETPTADQRRVFRLGIGKPGAAGTTAQRRTQRGAPDTLRHPIITKHRNPRATRVANRLDVMLELLLATFLAEDQLVVGLNGKGFYGEDAEPVCFRLIAQ